VHVCCRDYRRPCDDLMNKNCKKGIKVLVVYLKSPPIRVKIVSVVARGEVSSCLKRLAYGPYDRRSGRVATCDFHML
jgi:hypothetical protein